MADRDRKNGRALIARCAMGCATEAGQLHSIEWAKAHKNPPWGGLFSFGGIALADDPILTALRKPVSIYFRLHGRFFRLQSFVLRRLLTGI